MTYRLIAKWVVRNGVKKLKCPYCGYEWVPKVEKPKSCPYCKRYIIVLEG